MPKTVALSSGEAELPAAVKCSCETIGILQLAEDWEKAERGSIGGLVSGARCSERKRKGKVETCQSVPNLGAESGNLRYRKVKDTQQLADFITKEVIGIDINKYSATIHLEGKCGRARRSIAPEL